MDSPQLPPTMESLPGDVLTNIFIRLLAKQLAQMRRVSKSWNSLLSESSFVKSHLHRSIHNNDEMLLFIPHAYFLHRKPLIAGHSRSPDFELTNFIKTPFNLRSDNTWGSVIGSVHGLICYSDESRLDYVIYRWNPSLSAFLSLPPRSWPSSDSDCDFIVNYFRFGFDPKMDDYKVVKLTCVYPMVFEVEVYSMRKGCWELITQKVPPHTTMLGNQDEVCEDGHLHWFGFNNSEWKPNMIVEFDLGAETFREITLPDFIVNRHVYCLKVCRVFGGKLCVMARVKGSKCEVWVMDEHGVAESWVKHHAFSQFSCDIIPYGFTLHNNFIFRVHYDDDHFALYGPIADKTKTFIIPDGALATDKIVKYVDNLVWPSNCFR